jgi:hypothetical protein
MRQRCILFLICVVSMWDCKGAYADSDAFARYVQMRDGYIAQARTAYDVLVAQCKEIERTKGYGAGQECRAKDDREAASGRLDDLERQLQQLIGPYIRKGFSAKGKINLETLAPELGYGKLDGLIYSSVDGRTTILVTTKELLINWLNTSFEWPGGAGVHDPMAVLGTEPFYTQALGFDNHASDLGDLPILKPKGATVATAMLSTWSQDVVNFPPYLILATELYGDRVYLLSQQINVTMPPIQTCSRIFQKLWDSNREDDADVEYRRCYARKVRQRNSFAAVLRQAQSLGDRAATSSPTTREIRAPYESE